MKFAKAFTTIELIFIIVIVGIIAAVAIPKIERNGLIEAADQIVSHIRYTQQLAMNDNKFSATDPNWHRKAWRIQFHNGVVANQPKAWRYTIFWDNAVTTNAGNPNSENELAVDPMNPNKYLTSGFANETFSFNHAKMNKKLNIQETYSITNVEFGGACARMQTVTFDAKGRPMGQLTNSAIPYDKLFHSDCTITISNDNGDSAIITITKETGYVDYVLNLR
ncbi:MAG: type II secretion system protein [Campylobacter sp.]|nr:type II secretion system protein [Campylobacter sp.]